jgi:hypothetical protein
MWMSDLASRFVKQVLSNRFWLRMKLTAAICLHFLACQRCRLNQIRNQGRKKAAAEILKNSGVGDLSRFKKMI